jgi:xanthine dehydrogenase YagS FAD-binding subunit
VAVAAESALVGQPSDTENFRTAAELAIAGAIPLSQNGFKVDLAKHSIVRALRRASTMQR